MIFNIIKGFILVFGVLTGSAYMVWLERRVSAWIQDRIGPNRVGPFGLLQPLVDVVKLLFKEEIVPITAEKFIHFLAPGIIIVSVITASVLIPVDPNFIITNPGIGILLIMGLSSLSAYSVVLSGFASLTKYPVLGSLRASAQVVSYEIPIALSVLSVVVLSNSLSLVDIVNAQKETWFILINPIGFIVFLIASFAETNRAPFDLPEAESELTGGYHTEFSSMRFAWFFAGEYGHIIISSAVITTLFLGGYHGPIASGLWWFLIKVFILCYIFVWVRWTFPRLRYDQLMKFSWKLLIPVSLINLLIIALVKILQL
ncbi:MAG: NADH-quinone oxidoreductase subunit NuoH [candidate division WOR-3 bacterium]|nr:NADH-quinone oxidoreductase subunit NuoH [candidate division WOR-3 bacterium]MCX7947801.1 NADH-quinone oxidoreductase subunit NuoH [candidate division WOR-3 bacterium]MDW8150758.1 NADH-quinone oxidoreductase subunit NuoH [candidate division WOR-3 bacterium]